MNDRQREHLDRVLADMAWPRVRLSAEAAWRLPLLVLAAPVMLTLCLAACSFTVVALVLVWAADALVGVCDWLERKLWTPFKWAGVALLHWTFKEQSDAHQAD